jgi:hypothetical protein
MNKFSNKTYGNVNDCQTVLPPHDEEVMDKGYTRREPATNEARRITSDSLQRHRTDSFNFVGNAFADHQAVTGSTWYKPAQVRFYQENGQRRAYFEE